MDTKFNLLSGKTPICFKRKQQYNFFGVYTKTFGRFQLITIIEMWQHCDLQINTANRNWIWILSVFFQASKFMTEKRKKKHLFNGLYRDINPTNIPTSHDTSHYPHFILILLFFCLASIIKMKNNQSIWEWLHYCKIRENKRRLHQCKVNNAQWMSSETTTLQQPCIFPCFNPCVWSKCMFSCRSVCMIQYIFYKSHFVWDNLTSRNVFRL